MSRTAAAFGLEPIGYAVTYRAEASVPAAVVEHNVRTVMDVAAEFSGLVAEMNSAEMTPAQLARLDVIFASFEKILGDVRAIRAELQAAGVRV
jgi:hypothetical protein